MSTKDVLRLEKEELETKADIYRKYDYDGGN